MVSSEYEIRYLEAVNAANLVSALAEKKKYQRLADYYRGKVIDAWQER